MRIACIGNAVYDFTVSSNEYIKKGVRTSFYDPIYSVGGPASNAAAVIAKFIAEDSTVVNLDVDFYGRIGNDAFGKYIYEKMLSENINLNHLIVSNNVMTPFSFVILNPKEASRTILTVRSNVDYDNPTVEQENFETGYDYILTDGKYVEDTIKLIEANPQAKTVIDAGRVNSGVLKLCKKVNYIICSEEFAEEVTESKFGDNYENIKEVYSKLHAMFPNATGITITIGKEGYIFNKGEVIVNPAHIPEQPVIDTNGAGDIFHGAFTYAIAVGYDYYKALEFSNITASLSTTKTGGRDSCPSLYEVKDAMKTKKLIK